MLVTEDYGIPQCAQKITPGSTSTGLSKYCYRYKKYRLDFDDGDTELTVGSWLVGASSGAVSKIVEVNADTTSWTNNTGYVVLDSWNGTAYTDNEELKQAGTATAANVNGILKDWRGYDEKLPKGKMAKTVLIVVHDQAALVDITGGIPDQTALMGVRLDAGQNLTLNNVDAIRQFRVVDYTNSSATTIKATYFF